MGSKGQKYNKYSNELKKEIIDKYINGNYSSRYLAKEYGISYKTIDSMIYRHNHPEIIKTGKKGRPKNEESIDYKERYEILKKYRTFLKAQRERK